MLRAASASTQGSDHTSEGFPPLPTAEELQSLHSDGGRQKDETGVALSNSSRLLSGRGRPPANRVYKSPFLTGSFQPTDQSAVKSQSVARQQLPVKSFDYKAFQRTGSWLENRAAASRSGSQGSRGPSLGDRQRQRADSGSEVTAAAAVGTATGRGVSAEDRRTVASSSVSVSGVKPASHHEPGGHTCVAFCLDVSFCLSVCLYICLSDCVCLFICLWV